MRTYTELFRAPEFTPLFVTASVQIAAQTATGLALGTLIYSATGSPLLSALAMFGPALAQAAGAAALLSAADRLPPRATLAGLATVSGLAAAAEAIPGLPVAAIFAIVLAAGTIGSVGGGALYGLLNEILPRHGYLLGRSVFNMAVGVMQICGFAAGGVLLAVLSARGTMLVGAGLSLAAAAAARCGLSRRAPRASGRPSVGQTWRNNRRLWSSPGRRYVYLALWVPNGLIVGCESLFIPYAPRHAGLLFSCAAAGMLAGDTLAGRVWPERWRTWLGAPLRLLLAGPYLIFALHPALPLAVAAIVLASVGYSATLMLQQRLMALTPDDLSGHALGLHSSGMLTMQGLGAALAGAIASQVSPATTMAILAAASLAVTLTLAAGLRPEALPAQVGGGPAGGGGVAVLQGTHGAREGGGDALGG
ncbi:MAG TPA: MFS transporter [Streptosporangiaceae bacterium]